MRTRSAFSSTMAIPFLALFLTIGSSLSGFAFDKNETIDATAQGTSTQLGRIGTIRLIIYSYSTPEDKKVLDDAFMKGQNQGLVKALEDMKAVGRIQIPGTLGYDVSYIISIKTPTGRKVRFVTNRKISFGEAYRNSQSQAFNLSGGEFNINEQDKNKSGGVLYPAAQLVINKDGDLQIELRKNPWKLTNVIIYPKDKE
ncbi:MAG TPA: hypothetical protein VE779_12235 [Candidatus Angelobacter sp.]|nr:hypothetical protein [Candidatus Angelobacter sp.]